MNYVNKDVVMGGTGVKVPLQLYNNKCEHMQAHACPNPHFSLMPVRNVHVYGQGLIDSKGEEGM